MAIDGAQANYLSPDAGGFIGAMPRGPMATTPGTQMPTAPTPNPGTSQIPGISNPQDLMRQIMGMLLQQSLQRFFTGGIPQNSVFTPGLTVPSGMAGQQGQQVPGMSIPATPMMASTPGMQQPGMTQPAPTGTLATAGMQGPWGNMGQFGQFLSQMIPGMTPGPVGSMMGANPSEYGGVPTQQAQTPQSVNPGQANNPQMDMWMFILQQILPQLLGGARTQGAMGGVAGGMGPSNWAVPPMSPVPGRTL